MGLNPGLSFIIRCRFLQDGCWRKPLFLLPLLFEFLYPLHHPAERAFCRSPRCEAGVIARISAESFRQRFKRSTVRAPQACKW